MSGMILTTCGVILISFLATPLLGAGIAWDAGNGLGLVAMGGLLYLVASSSPRADLRAHQVFGYAVLGIATLHAFWFPLADPVAMTYVMPGAPAYMWMGVASFVLLVGMMIVGMPQYRMRLYTRYAAFRYWHRLLALATLAAAGWHLLGSGLYFSAWYQAALLVASIAVVCLGDRDRLRRAVIDRSTPVAYLLTGIIATLCFVGLRNLPA